MAFKSLDLPATGKTDADLNTAGPQQLVPEQYAHSLKQIQELASLVQE